MSQKPTKFKELHSKNKDSAEIAIEVIESVIAESAQRLIELENMQGFVIGSFFEAIEEEQLSEAKETKASAEEQAARSRAADTEEFDDIDDFTERKRDMAVAHASHNVMEDEKILGVEAKKQELKAKEEEQKIKGQMDEMKKSERMLRDDLRELQSAVRDALVAEWENAKDQTEMKL